MSDLPLFDGRTYNAGRDGSRLRAQLRAVRSLMMDGKWRTLGEIAASTGYPEASISARLRDLKKLRYGSYDVQKEHIDRGLWRYRVCPK